MSNWIVGNQPWQTPLTSVAAVESVFQRAEAAFQNSNYDEAGPLYRQLLDANHSPGVMLYRLGMIANAREDFIAAWDLHHRAIAIDPALAAKITQPEFPHHRLVLRPSFNTEEVPLCPVCGSAEQRTLRVVNYLAWSEYHPSFHPVRRWALCLVCGHGFANPRPTAEAIQEAFRDPAPQHLATWAYDKLTLYSDIIHALWERHPGGDFLDIGVANGGMAGVAADFGYRAAGLDLHSAFAASVQALGIEFILADIATHDFGGRQFDVITMGDVIEHVMDPHKVMANVVSILRPGGLIWLSTPNHEGIWTRAVRDKDPMWREGEHMQYFSLRSLKRLLRDYGLAVVDYRLSKRFVGCAEVMIERAENKQDASA